MPTALTLEYTNESTSISVSLLPSTPGADLGGGCWGCAPLPEMTYGFLIQVVFCQKKCGLLVLVTAFLSGAPLLKKFLDLPLNTHLMFVYALSQNILTI